MLLRNEKAMHSPLSAFSLKMLLPDTLCESLVTDFDFVAWCCIVCKITTQTPSQAKTTRVSSDFGSFFGETISSNNEQLRNML